MVINLVFIMRTATCWVHTLSSMKTQRVSCLQLTLNTAQPGVNPICIGVVQNIGLYIKIIIDEMHTIVFRDF